MRQWPDTIAVASLASEYRSFEERESNECHSSPRALYDRDTGYLHVDHFVTVAINTADLQVQVC